ncbi:D-serine ammonia-lyase [Oceanobacillus senegalensis]|uniref:D-serine ammonia-lyase n=1 Tax=Oceanobacillus senegalensis TaxID=1936063 RepID=UPI000A307444|nr:D-serine ammonia-lyase [Oceanobacillus senegalensis]
MLAHTEIQTLQDKFPIMKEILKLKPVFWVNPKAKKLEEGSFSLGHKDVVEAENLWRRYTPFFKKVFPETKQLNGWIESPLEKVDSMKNELEKFYATTLEGDLFLKCDNKLPIAGSVKARGGIFEILHYAATLAQDAGLIGKEESFESLSNPEFKELFSEYTIGVGSTGNLGLSIGIMSAKLGFQVNVYMSKDAKQWKKDLLREKGATVYEFTGDFSEAVTEGRKKTNANPKGYFVDDENSKHLFLGYSTVAFRLKKQLDEKGIVVDQDHPLFVYLPCGVGGAPGGITFGLKQLFGDHVHCFFAEPVHSPSMLVGLLTGLKNEVSVQDIGIDNQTAADGLAVGRPSIFASSFSEQLVSGIYTIEDDKLFQLLQLLAKSENIYVEPSATAGFSGPFEVLNSNYMKDKSMQTEKATHIVWATGGGLVPEDEMNTFLNR